MTRKDFELIAASLRASCPTEHTLGIKNEHDFYERLATWTLACLDMGLKLNEAHPNFQLQRFIEACGASQSIDCPEVLK